jgi:pimeloyl-ACP methyl ester carboxylesterase
VSQAAQQDALAAVLGDAGWQDLAEITAPATLIRGDHGYVTETDAADFRERVPTAAVVTVPSGHNVQEEQPVDLGRRLRDLAGKG